MTSRSPVLIALAILVLGGLLSYAVSAGQGPPPQEEPDLKLQVEKLEARVQELDKRVQMLETWLARVPEAMSGLHRNVNEAEKLGFTYAAPNPASKEKLLEALRQVSQDLRHGIPVPEKK